MHLQPWSWSWHRKFSWARLALSPGTLPPGLWIKPNFIRVLHNRRISAIKTEILLRNEPQIVRLSHWISYQIILHARKEIVLEEGGGGKERGWDIPHEGRGQRKKHGTHWPSKYFPYATDSRYENCCIRTHTQTVLHILVRQRGQAEQLYNGSRDTANIWSKWKWK